MGDYERIERVDSPPERVFDYLSDPTNIPRYVPSVTHVEAVPPRGIRLSGRDTAGAAVVVSGWLYADSDGRHIDFATELPVSCRGRIDIAAEGAGTEISVRVQADEPDPEGLIHQVAAALDNVQTVLTARRGHHSGSDRGGIST